MLRSKLPTPGVVLQPSLPLYAVASVQGNVYRGVTPIVYGAFGWALVLAGGSVTLVLSVHGQPWAFLVGLGSVVVGWIAWRLTTCKVIIDVTKRTVVVRQPGAPSPSRWTISREHE